jgi:hypothetical protein
LWGITDPPQPIRSGWQNLALASCLHQESPHPNIIFDQKVSPNSSPKSSPGEQFGGNKRAMHSVEKEVEKTVCSLVKQG